MRRASTEFNVRSGSTLVIGGFLSREQGRDVSGLPGLLDVPVLGALFASRRYQLRETELAIFVTPRIGSRRIPAWPSGRDAAGTCSTRRFPTPRLGTSSLAADPDPAARVGPYRGPGSQWSDAAAVRAPHNQE